MVEMVNGFTHTQMWVADDRVEEYLAAGHSLAATPLAEKPAEDEKPKKKTTTKKK